MSSAAHSTRAGRRGVLPVLVLCITVLVAAPPADAATKRKKVTTAAAALPAGQLVRDRGLSDLLMALLPTLFAPPPVAVGALSPGVVSTVTASTVKVSGVACGVLVEGSGFSPAPDTIVTNAHVVAGVRNAQVLRPDGRRLPATVAAFDPDRDLAVLTVPGLGQPSLPLGSATVGTTGAVFGHPRGQVPVEVSPARVERRVDALVGNIYDQGPVRRQILVLASELEPGDSGSPLVNGSGAVVGVAFAISSWSRGTAFAVAGEEMAPVLARPRTGPVSTGPCLD